MAQTPISNLPFDLAAIIIAQCDTLADKMSLASTTTTFREGARLYFTDVHSRISDFVQTHTNIKFVLYEQMAGVMITDDKNFEDNKIFIPLLMPHDPDGKEVNILTGSEHVIDLVASPLLVKHLLNYVKDYLDVRSATDIERTAELKAVEAPFDWQSFIAIIDNALSTIHELEEKAKTVTRCYQKGAAKQKASYITYNKKKYKVKMGSRGGKYITVDGKKIYIQSK
jgi:hypothetical protein